MTFNSIPLRKCSACGSRRAAPVAFWEAGFNHYLIYACPDCGAEFRVPPTGSSAYWIVMGVLAAGGVIVLYGLWDSKTAWLVLALLAGLFALWQVWPALRHPATGPAPGTPAELMPSADAFDDPMRKDLHQIDHMPAWKAAGMPILFVALVMAAAVILGLVHDAWRSHTKTDLDPDRFEQIKKP